MKRTITAAALLLTAITAHAAPNQRTGVDCDAIAAAGLTSYTAQGGKPDQTLAERLKTGCTIGIGAYMLGNGLEKALNDSAPMPFVGNDPTAAAAVLSALSQGWLYASAHAVSEKDTAK